MKRASLIFLIPSLALASGFRLETHHARASAMGIAVTGLIDDASAVYYNPAGIVGRKGFEATAGISVVIPTLSFHSQFTDQTTVTVTKLSTPINVFVAWGITDNVALGLGFFTPFGAGNTWPEGWEGQGRALVSSLQTFELNPTVAWRVHPRFKVAAGLQLVRGSVGIERALNFIDSTGRVQLGGSANGIGWNVGTQIDLIENMLTLGASWRSSVGMTFAGSAHFSSFPASFATRLVDQSITARVTLPDVISVGLGYRPTKRLRFGADVNVTTWSSFRELLIEFKNPDLTSPLPKKWSDTASFHAGVEYDLSESLQARGGFVYDIGATPVATLTPDLPDASRIRITAGLGWKSTFGLSVDLAYQFVILLLQTSKAPGFEGTYAGSAQVIGLNVGYKL